MLNSVNGEVKNRLLFFYIKKIPYFCVKKEFNIKIKNDEDVIQYYALKSGDDVKGCVVNRIFGCNNINGTPKGTARVHVFQTQGDATHVRTESGKVDSATGSDHSYEVEAVYGGGNKAKVWGNTHVNIGKD